MKVAVMDCREFRFTSTWVNQVNPSNFMSRSSGGRLLTGVRTNRYSNDSVKATLFLMSGPVKVARGVAASIPTKSPSRLRGLGRRFCIEK